MFTELLNSLLHAPLELQAIVLMGLKASSIDKARFQVVGARARHPGHQEEQDTE